jgi:prepilin-type N-terminal cleavage/methylation domain-containing protein
MKSLQQNQKGFTLIELMIATTVFSVILLLCTYGLIQIGNTFYKGRTAAMTQNTARSVMDSITQAIQYGGKDVTPATTTVVDAGVASAAFCTGNNRYRYQRDFQVGRDSGRGALIVDDQVAGCVNDSSRGSNAKELLGHNMRITNFSITRNGTSYKIDLVIVYGDNDVLVGDKCKTGAGSQFCAVSGLSTTVQRRIK